MTDPATVDWIAALQSDAVRFIADAIPGPVSYLDTELRYRFVNVQYSRFLTRIGSSLDLETILGKTPLEAYGSHMAAPLMANLERALAGEQLTVEVGVPEWRTLNSYIPHVVDGEVAGVLLVAQDITALHNSRAAVVQAERMASLGRLVAGLLHEVNTPVGVLRSSLQTLELLLRRLRTDGELTENTLARLDQLETVVSGASAASERIVSMMQRLRSFSRVDQANVQTMDLHEGIDTTLSLLAPQLHSEIEVVKAYGDLPEIECEAGSINQVFMALLSNAINALEAGGTLTIRTAADAEQVHVEVIDTGVGIAAERIADLFSPAFAVGGDRVKAGVGLFVAHHIAQKHQGTLRAESELGKGSRFTLSLPRQPADPR